MQPLNPATNLLLIASSQAGLAETSADSVLLEKQPKMLQLSKSPYLLQRASSRPNGPPVEGWWSTGRPGDQLYRFPEALLTVGVEAASSLDADLGDGSDDGAVGAPLTDQIHDPVCDLPDQRDPSLLVLRRLKRQKITLMWCFRTILSIGSGCCALKPSRSDERLTMATWISLPALADGSQVMEMEESADRFLTM